MTNKKLSQYFSLDRRYSRSINVERDLESVEALEGYILTTRANSALNRIWSCQGTLRVSAATALAERNYYAWTLTSVYGTGKSSFAHFLASLCAPVNDPMRNKALEIAALALGTDSPQYQELKKNYPTEGYVRAVATAAREPISHTVIRALNRGIKSFWKQPDNIPVIAKLIDLEKEINAGNSSIDSRQIPRLVLEVAKASKTGVILILDELGKNLEFAAYNTALWTEKSGAEDLYLLQQLAELPRNTATTVYILGILHQAFADYGQRLASKERNEWSKVQGRFEDIAFTESPGEMMRLIGKSIDPSKAESFQCAIHTQANEWFKCLSPIIQDEDLTEEVFRQVYPLHPLTSLVLPILCQRYAQNDRSLFTFLTSIEPFSLRNFLEEVTVVDSRADGTLDNTLPTLKLDRVYDYFVESVGMGLTTRPHLQRWVEIQELITDAKNLSPDSLKVLKTIGILNLITTTGTVRATEELVILAMSNIPFDIGQNDFWQQVIQGLKQKGIITHRRQINELRIWQGSDVNVDLELASYMEKERSPLFSLLTKHRPLNPVVAQRHSYNTGTLRYFERHYLDHSVSMKDLSCSSPDLDGFIGYWVDDKLPTEVPAYTADGKPFILLCASKLDVLRINTFELAALKEIQAKAPELQTDAVARKEVRYRITEAEKLLDDSLNQAFARSTNNQNICWIFGKQESIRHISEFKAKLSQVCDKVYDKSPILWNELINRRELTSQGAKARRDLIEAMIEHSEEEKLGLDGYGPEVSMYYSVLKKEKIHRQEDNYWGFYPPLESSGLWILWQTVEHFCLEAKEKPKTLDLLYEKLAAPPYGVKQGPIPVIIAAVLLYHIDDVGLYKDGTFVPILGTEHFELLLKDPSRFAVKHFEFIGLRSQVFKELEAILSSYKAKKSDKLRNTTLLSVVTPLYQFVKKLPAYTKQTKEMGSEAAAVLRTIQQTIEPDELLFTELPRACNLPPIEIEAIDNEAIAKTLRTKLVQSLREINNAYDGLLSKCQSLLYDAFGVRSSETKLREDLRVRSLYLTDKCVERSLKSFTQAAIEEAKSDHEWLEALVMIVSDKPAESWTDTDATGFESKLADLARRFKNLEAIQKDVTAKGQGLEARRITISRPDGQETHKLVWVDNEREDQVEELVNKVLEILPNDTQIQQAVLAKLTERVLNMEQVWTSSQKNRSKN